MNEIMTATEAQKINAKYLEKLKQGIEEIQKKMQQDMDALEEKLHAEFLTDIQMLKISELPIRATQNSEHLGGNRAR